MEVDAKAFMVLLKAEAHPYVMAVLGHTPQFAYRSGVSATDAILRVGAHCHSVRKALEGASTSHLSKLLGDEIPELVGGLALSLDLSKAFDNLQISEMCEAMANAGMPEYLARLILHVHRQSACDIAHGAYSASMCMKRGLRQGCPIAPIIYSAPHSYAGAFVNQLGEGWDKRTITLFANDKILCWQIRSMKQLERALGQIPVVLDALENARMKVNIPKSEVLMTRLASGLYVSEEVKIT